MNLFDLPERLQKRARSAEAALPKQNLGAICCHGSRIPRRADISDLRPLSSVNHLATAKACRSVS